MKQRYMMVVLLLISVLEAGAAEVPASSKKQVLGFTPRLKKEAEIRASFKKLSQAVDLLDSDAQLEIYRGVPRALVADFEKSMRTRNANNKELMSRYASVFYAQGETASRKDSEKLLALVKTPRSFKEFSGFKLCGWFHPNYALVWTKGKMVVEIHVCLTCHEIKIFHSRLEIYCEIDNDAYQQLLGFGKALEEESK